MSEKATSTPAHGCVLAVVGFQILVILVALAMAASEYVHKSSTVLVWRYEHGERNFQGIELPTANLQGATLAGADLREASLGNLNGADLRGANLSEASLGDVHGADLREANLSGADLANAWLSGANLSGAIVTDEQLAATRDGTSTSFQAATAVATSVAQTDGMICVPAGGFLMGSLDDDPDASEAEKPQHTVYLDAYWIDRVEVTNSASAQCVKAGVCEARHHIDSYLRASYFANPEYDNYSVIYVSWADARAYCQWAGGRLPTEAEWEKAARGTEGRKYPWGNEPPDCDRLNYTGPDGRCVGDTTSVGAYSSGASPYGALDMAGNVAEWVANWYDGTHYTSSPARNPTGPASGQKHVIRGGSWGVDKGDVRAAHRFGYPGADEIIGFRCARSD